MRLAIDRIIPWVIIGLPFVILALAYEGLPQQVLITRNIDGSGAVFGPKSLITVFRVPLIELVCGLAIEIMRGNSRTAFPEYHRLWTILLYTVAFKSLLQALETISSPESATMFLYMTIAVVVIGIAMIVIPAYLVLTGASSRGRKLTLFEGLALGGLLLTYILLAVFPAFIFG